MHDQNPGQRPQVKLLCGLLMFLTVRAVPERGVTKKEINDKCVPEHCDFKKRFKGLVTSLLSPDTVQTGNSHKHIYGM